MGRAGAAAGRQNGVGARVHVGRAVLSEGKALRWTHKEDRTEPHEDVDAALPLVVYCKVESYYAQQAKWQQHKNERRKEMK
jgi:hypothetical protein